MFFRQLLQSVETRDGLWAWIVCFASFGLFFCVGGVRLTFGVLYIGLLESFTSDSNASIGQALNFSRNVTSDSTLSGDLGKQLPSCTGYLSTLALILPREGLMRSIIS